MKFILQPRVSWSFLQNYNHKAVKKMDVVMLFKKPLKTLLRNTLDTCKQSLMMVFEKSESFRDNFGKFIYQLQPEAKTLVRKLEKS